MRRRIPLFIRKSSARLCRLPSTDGRRTAPVSHQKQLEQTTTNAIETEQKHSRINEADRYSAAHNGLVAGSSPAGPTTLRPSGFAWHSRVEVEGAERVRRSWSAAKAKTDWSQGTGDRARDDMFRLQSLPYNPGQPIASRSTRPRFRCWSGLLLDWPRRGSAGRFYLPRSRRRRRHDRHGSPPRRILSPPMGDARRGSYSDRAIIPHQFRTRSNLIETQRTHQNRPANSPSRRCAAFLAAQIGSAGPVVGPIGTNRTLLTPMKRNASRK